MSANSSEPAVETQIVLVQGWTSAEYKACA